jgi:hypothetical protein
MRKGVSIIDGRDGRAMMPIRLVSWRDGEHGVKGRKRVLSLDDLEQAAADEAN